MLEVLHHRRNLAHDMLNDVLVLADGLVPIHLSGRRQAVRQVPGLVWLGRGEAAGDDIARMVMKICVHTAQHTHVITHGANRST